MVAPVTVRAVRPIRALGVPRRVGLTRAPLDPATLSHEPRGRKTRDHETRGHELTAHEPMARGLPEAGPPCRCRTPTA